MYLGISPSKSIARWCESRNQVEWWCFVQAMLTETMIGTTFSFRKGLNGLGLRNQERVWCGSIGRGFEAVQGFAPNKRMKPTMLSSLVLRLFSLLSVSNPVSHHCASRMAAYARVVMFKDFKRSAILSDQLEESLCPLL